MSEPDTTSLPEVVYPTEIDNPPTSSSSSEPPRPATTTSSSPSLTDKTIITSFPLNPLTTTFTAPSPDCSGIYWPVESIVYMVDDQPTCIPSGYDITNTNFYYSPGLACPSGYWTACHDTTGVSSITTVTCCPTRGEDISLSCIAPDRTKRNGWETLQCTWTVPTGRETVLRVTQSLDGRTSTKGETLSFGDGINAYGIRMVYEASDVESGATTATTATTGGDGDTGRTTAEGADGPAETGGAGSGAGESPSGSGLSTGATVAIAVVVPVVVLAVLAGLFVWWWRKRRRASLGRGPVAELDPQMNMGEANSKYYQGASPPSHELEGSWDIPEMASQRAAAELPVTPITRR